MRLAIAGSILMAALVAPVPVLAQSPTPDPMASASPVPSLTPYVSDIPGLAPPPSPTGTPWTATLARPKEGRLSGVVVWDGGVVVIGTDRDDHNVTWASPDGLTWTRAPEPFPRGRMRWTPIHLVPFGDRLLAFGSIDKRLAVWSSRDGLHWNRQADQRAFASGGVDFEAPLDVTGAAATTDLIVVTGYYQFDWSHATRTWWSQDGATWHRVAIDDPVLQYLDRPVAVDGGIIAAACCDREDGPADTRLARTTDGVTWTVVGTLPSRASGPLAARPDGTLYISGFPGDDSDTPAASVWTSADGRSWSLLATGPEGISGEAALAVDDRTILLGGDSYEQDVSAWDWTLGSTDDGTWQLSAGWPGLAPGCIDALALLPDRAIAVGGCDGSRAWVMERSD